MSSTWRIASWNVNSLKVREAQVADWLSSTQPEVLGLQETKTTDETFPTATWEALGYHTYFHGQKTYNGVALLSKSPLTNVQHNVLNLDDNQARSIVGVRNQTLIVNLYVPNGSTLDSDKYPYKCRFLTALQDYLVKQQAQYTDIIVMGDFNIAPLDIDIHDPEAWQDSVLTSDTVRNHLQSIINLGFTDTFRAHHPEDPGFTWWDYRQASFRRNRGLRIDLLLASTNCFSRNIDTIVDAAPRAQERPSDHAPVIGTFTE